VSKYGQQEQDSDFKTTTRNKTREPQDQDRQHFKTSVSRDVSRPTLKARELQDPVLVWYCFSPQYLCRDKGCTHKEKEKKKTKIVGALGPRPLWMGINVVDDLKQAHLPVCVTSYHAKFGISATKCVRGAPAQPTFGSSPQFMCISFDAELPNLNTYWPSTHYTV